MDLPKKSKPYPTIDAVESRSRPRSGSTPFWSPLGSHGSPTAPGTACPIFPEFSRQCSPTILISRGSPTRIALGPQDRATMCPRAGSKIASRPRLFSGGRQRATRVVAARVVAARAWEAGPMHRTPRAPRSNARKRHSTWPWWWSQRCRRRTAMCRASRSLPQVRPVARCPGTSGCGTTHAPPK
jgi:hypothetical protein